LLEEKERIVEIEDNARRKLASDLHDGPTQNVSILATRINLCIKLIEKKPEELPKELAKIEEIARRASTEMRQILFLWRPLVLESHGLGLALQQLAQKMEETHGQRVQVRIVGDVEYLLDKNQQVVVFHIVEEAVNNARKHANAALVGVSISRRHDTAVLQIADNGFGFDASSTLQGGGRNSLGMVNMRERAELIEGSFNVDSAPGRGTVITVIIPLKESELAKQGIELGSGVQNRPRKSMTKLALAAVARVNSVKDTQPAPKAP
jgi:signal transduction histidine kinase